MTGLATALKKEIAAAVRRETLKAVAPLKAEIATLQRLVREQGRRVAKAGAHRAGASRRAPVEAAGPRLSGASVRRHRMRLGLTQRDLARLVGVTPVAVYFWESGRTKPGPRTQATLLELRDIGVREVKRRLEQLDEAPKPSRRKRATKKKRKKKARRR